jgi:hypothetical protein
MNKESELESIEISIDQARKAIEKRNKLRTLIKDHNFTAIIDDGYFKDEAVRLVHLRSDYNFQSEKDQEDNLKQIEAIGTFKAYLHSIFQQGQAAVNALEGHEQTREEILGEDLEGDD